MIVTNLEQFKAFLASGLLDERTATPRILVRFGPDTNSGSSTTNSVDFWYGDLARVEIFANGGFAASAAPTDTVSLHLLSPAPAILGTGKSVLDSELLALASYGASLSPMTDSAAESLLAAQFPHLQFSGDKVVVDIGAEDPEAMLALLESLGLEQGATAGYLVSGLLPIEAIGWLPEIAGLRFARSSQAITRAGSTTYQGDAAMLTDDVRADDGLDGSGISVGILSDSFDDLGGYAADIASSDLPNDVNVLDDLDASGSDEGRAMAQIVHDIAPGADLLFATAFGGQAVFASNILALAAAGSEIIVDDVLYLAEPMFQDGVVAQAVDEVTADGVLYFSSAGNQGDDSYESAFVDSLISILLDPPAAPIIYDLHDFDPGAGVDERLTVTIPEGETLQLSFQWDQPFFSVSGGAGSQSNLDIFLVVAGTLDVVALTSIDNVGGDAAEVLTFTNDTAGTNFEILIGMEQGVGSAPGLMKFVGFGNASFPEYAVDKSTSFGHNNAEGAFSVAASAFFETPEFGETPPLPEPFTSLGGTPILFDKDGTRLASSLDRGKVDFTAVDGGNTTFFGQSGLEDGDSFPNFFGTSAAAPAAAALAALLLDAIPSSSRAQIETALLASAIDMADPGWDALTGAGLIQGPSALDALFALDNLLEGDATANVIAGLGGNDTIFGFGGKDLLFGDAGDDLMLGGDAKDQLLAGAGNDQLFGEAGNDILIGGSQNDFLSGGAGNDKLGGGGGADTVNGGDGADKLFGAAGNDKLRGDDGDDELSGGEGNDVLQGGGEDDLLLGGDGLDALYGGEGEDTLLGNGGADILSGGTGNDTLEGGGSIDTLRGDAGDDVLTGGSGGDLFVFEDASGLDVITDFGNGADLIDLSDYVEENGGQPLSFDQLLITQVGADTRIELDLDENGVADAIDLDGNAVGDVWSVTLSDTNAATISAADFVF